MSTPKAGETKGEEDTWTGHRIQNRAHCLDGVDISGSWRRGLWAQRRNPYLDARGTSKVCNKVVSGRKGSRKRNHLYCSWGDIGRNKRRRRKGGSLLPSTPSFQCFWQNRTGSQLAEQCSSRNPSPRFTNRAAQIWSSHSALVKLSLPVFINHSCFFEFPNLSNLHFS